MFAETKRRLDILEKRYKKLEQRVAELESYEYRLARVKRKATKPEAEEPVKKDEPKIILAGKVNDSDPELRFIKANTKYNGDIYMSVIKTIDSILEKKKYDFKEIRKIIEGVLERARVPPARYHFYMRFMRDKGYVKKANRTTYQWLGLNE